MTPPTPTPPLLPPWEETLAESKAWDRWYDPYGYNDDDYDDNED